MLDTNKLWFVSENKSVYPAWSFHTAITGNTLIHSSGATNIDSISFSSAALTQLHPAVNHQTKKVLLDGLSEITDDGLYSCNSLDIVNSYNITNPAAVLNYVVSQVGGTTQPAFNGDDIASDVWRTLTYRYAENGSCTIVDSVQVLNPISLGYFGVTQAMGLTATNRQLWQYIPRVKPIAGTVKTWDFAAGENISGTFEQCNTLDKSRQSAGSHGANRQIVCRSRRTWVDDRLYAGAIYGYSLGAKNAGD